MQKTTKISIILHVFCLVVVLAALVSAGFFITATNTGLNFTVRIMQLFVPGKLEIAVITGTLRGPIELKKITYKNPAFTFAAEKIKFDWQLEVLFLNHIHITYADVQNVKVFDNTPTDIKYFLSLAWRNLHLPTTFDWQVDKLHVANVIYSSKENTKQETKIDSIDLSAQITPEKINNLNLKLVAQKACFMLEIKNKLELRWRLYLPQIAQFIQACRGSVIGNGKVAFNDKDYFLTLIAENRIDNFQGGDVKILHVDNYVDITGDKGTFTLNVMQFANKYFSSPKLKISGIYANNVKIPQQQLNINFGETRFNLGKAQKANSIVMRGGLVKMLCDKKNVQAHGTIFFTKIAPFIFNINLPHYAFSTWFGEHQTISGDAKWQSDNVNFMQSWFPSLKNLSGNLQLQLKLAGVLGAPKVTGTVDFIHGSAIIPQLSLTLSDINISVKALENKVLNYVAHLRSGSGVLNAEGQLKYFDKEVTSDGKIYGDNILAVNTNGCKVIISPKLTFSFAKNKINLDGKVFIPEAKIAPASLNQGLNLPPETTFVQQSRHGVESPQYLPLYSKIQVVLGDDVAIDVMNIHGKIVGDAVFYDVPQGDTTAIGKFTLQKGSYYEMYGQQLKIMDGYMLYSGGSVSNPNLSIKAVRNIRNAVLPPNNEQIDRLTVGLYVKGYLDNLNTTLFSEPLGLSAGDILAYLVLGQASSEVSASGTQVLFRAANALNFGGSSQSLGKLLGDFKRRLGLNVLTMGTEQEVTTVEKRGYFANQVTSHTALMLGKYLSPKIYVGYSMGIADAFNVFRVRYYFNKQLSVQSESSTNGNGVDVLYTVEKD